LLVERRGKILATGTDLNNQLWKRGSCTRSSPDIKTTVPTQRSIKVTDGLDFLRISDRDQCFQPNSATAEFELEAVPHFETLRRRASMLLRDHFLAFDAVQETYLIAWKSFHRYDRGTNCRAWLDRILYHVIQNLRRTQTRWITGVREELFNLEAAPPPRLTGEEIDEELIAAIGRLEPVFRSVLLLVDVEQFTYQEASSALKVPIGTVMSRLSRARATIREQLSPTPGGSFTVRGKIDRVSNAIPLLRSRPNSHHATPATQTPALPT
jgi:RNA polymerase sigma-70 factor (ECF subfamily)